MDAKHKSPDELSYEEQVAIARANLERHLEEARRAAAEWEAKHGDPAETLDAYVRRVFPDPESFAKTWREWREESGHVLADEW